MQGKVKTSFKDYQDQSYVLNSVFEYFDRMFARVRRLWKAQDGDNPGFRGSMDSETFSLFRLRFACRVSYISNVDARGAQFLWTRQAKNRPYEGADYL